MGPEIYGISALDYLNRARIQLAEGTLAALFYAAFELRSGVEARLREYLEQQDHVAKKKRREWNLKKLGRTSEETFKIGDKVARYTFYDRDSGVLLGTLYYTPVSSSLQSEAEQLGNYLHAARDYRHPEDPWWGEFRASLERIYGELKKATMGQLLGAPLQSKTGRLAMPLEWSGDDRPLGKVTPGSRVTFEVEYLDNYPEELFQDDESFSKGIR
jgi:hypothetical protein